MQTPAPVGHSASKAVEISVHAAVDGTTLLEPRAVHSRLRAARRDFERAAAALRRRQFRSDR